MCGRYSIFTELDNIEMRGIIDDINRRLGHVDIKTGEVCPTDTAPVLAAESGKIRALPMSWGFPRYGASGVVINAKSETAEQKQMFRSSLSSRRCAVPSTGFFEWLHVGGKKQKEKYLLRLKDSDMLYMAGIYSLFAGKNGIAPHFVILTTPSNDSVAPIHDRMPVILEKIQIASWLSDPGSVPEILTSKGPELVLNKVQQV